jgi:hypothetical protein
MRTALVLDALEQALWPAAAKARPAQAGQSPGHAPRRRQPDARRAPVPASLTASPGWQTADLCSVMRSRTRIDART